MKIIKRNGAEVTFDAAKIETAITKANETVDEGARMTPMQIHRIAEAVELNCIRMNRAPSVEEIQGGDMLLTGTCVVCILMSMY